MSANLVPTDATLLHYGSGKGYIPGISIVQSNLTSSTPPPTLDSGNVVTLTNTAPLVDTTDSTVVGSNKIFRSSSITSTNTTFPTASVFDSTTLNLYQNVACNTSATSQGGQNGTNRSYNQLSSINRGGSAPVDLILSSNYIKFGSPADTYMGTSTGQEHVLITTNSNRNNQNALGIRGSTMYAPATAVQGDPCLRITPFIPVSGSTPVGTVRDIQLNDPLQAGPFALPLSYLSPAGNAVLFRSNGLTNNRSIPISECGVTISTTAVPTGTLFSLTGTPSYNTGVGANTYLIGSGSVTLPSDSLGKTYVIEAFVTAKSAVDISVDDSIQLRGGIITNVGTVVLATNNFNTLSSTKAMNIAIKTFYTSVVNKEVIGLYNNSGQTVTPSVLGKILIRETPRSDT